MYIYSKIYNNKTNYMKKDLIIEEILRQNKHWNDAKYFYDPKKYERNLLKSLKKYLPNEQILSIVGLRRTGKTTILKQLINYLIDSEKINPKNILLLSFDEALITSKLSLNKYFDAFLDNLDDKTRKYIFIDEIQYINKWQHILKRYYDTRGNIKFIVSGSSSIFIRKKTTESLVGRNYEFKLPHLSFGEYLEMSKAPSALIGEYKKFSIADIDKISRNDKEYLWFLMQYGKKLQNLFEEYLLNYQFPETIAIGDKREIADYVESSIYKKTIEYDIPRLFDINKIDELKFIFRILIDETGQEMEFGKMSSEAGIDMHTLKKYMVYFHDSLLFDLVYNYSKSIRKSRRLQKKGYIASTNFFTAFHPELRESKPASDLYMGKLVETYIYNILKEKYEYISFYKKEKKEIDFVCNNEVLNKKSAKLIEVKYANDIEKENFSFLANTAKKIFKTDKYFIFSKNQFATDDDKVVIPCFLIA